MPPDPAKTHPEPSNCSRRPTLLPAGRVSRIRPGAKVAVGVVFCAKYYLGSNIFWQQSSQARTSLYFLFFQLAQLVARGGLNDREVGNRQGCIFVQRKNGQKLSYELFGLAMSEADRKDWLIKENAINKTRTMFIRSSLRNHTKLIE